MNKIIKLTKIFLKNSFSNMNSKMGISNDGKSKIASKIVYAILFTYLAGIIVFFSYNVIDGLKMIQQETVFVGMILFMVLAFIAIQTIFSSINILYFTKDNEYLLPLPLKPYQIIFARTNVMLITQYLIIFLVGIIPLTLYGILTNANFTFYILMLISIVLIPILPVLLISIVVMIIMSFAKITKNRNKFQLIATILLLVIAIAISISTSGMNDKMSSEEMAQMVLQANGMIELVKGYFPTLDYLINALTTTSLSIAVLEILKTIGLTAIGFIIYMLIAQKIYFKGLIGNLFGGGAKKSNKAINQKEYENSKLYKSYIGKEFKILIRNPIFLMQCLVPAILIPILMIVITLGGIYSESGKGKMQELINMLQTMQTNSFTIMCVILGIIQFFTMFIYISITAVSRDGGNAVFMKYIPVSLYKQYIYKIAPNIVMNIITILITMGVAQYLLHLPILTFILLFIVATIMGILQSILMIIIDLKRPKLEWDTEYAVVKQNLNLVFPVILSMINIAIIVILGIILNSLNVYIGLVITGVIFGVVTYITNRYLYKNQYILANKII